MKIILNNNIENSSLQIGDMAYYIDSTLNALYQDKFFITGEPEPVGKITSIGSDFITVDSGVTLYPNDFIMFQKDRKVNNASLLGYYAEVTLKNNSEDEAEMFIINSEVSASSK